MKQKRKLNAAAAVFFTTMVFSGMPFLHAEPAVDGAVGEIGPTDSADNTQSRHVPEQRRDRGNILEALAGGDGDSEGENRPDGWDKGNKTGWGDEDLPPGQLKKNKEHPIKVKTKKD